MKRYARITIIIALSLLLLPSCGALFFWAPGVGSIGFWGKVIDQYGNPVPGVDILCYGGGGYLGGGSGYGRLKTDENGLFNIREMSGGSLNFREMTKEGYQIVISSKDDLFRGWKKKHSIAHVWSDYKKDNPFIFHAWKISEKFKDQTVLRYGWITTSFMIDEKGYLVDINGPPLQRYKQELAGANFRINFVRDFDSSGKATEDFTLTITALDGGIQKTEARYTNEAPVVGYKKSITYTRDDCISSDRGYREQTIYFTIDNGNTYGRARLSFNFNGQRGGDMGILYSINSKGEIYLDSFNGWRL